MNPRTTLSDRIIPILTFLLLSTPLSYIGTVFHEEGHGLLALAQGGTFSGIVIEQGAAYALANSYLVSIGGWIGDYLLLAVVLTVSWKLKPKSFLARSAVAMIVIHEAFTVPRYIASLQGDAEATLQVLERAGVKSGTSVFLLESVACALLAIGVYISWRVLRSYFSQSFPWMEGRRSSRVAMLFVVLVTISVFSTIAPTEGPVIASDFVFQALVAAGLLFLFSLVAIPPAPESWPKASDSRVPIPTFAFSILLFIEAELVYFFVLPVTIPFP